jgi:hypothetical protein
MEGVRERLGDPHAAANRSLASIMHSGLKRLSQRGVQSLWERLQLVRTRRERDT